MIKILACVFMVIDHIGLIFFPQYEALRIVGRLSMPFFAYCIARGIKYTKNIKSYLKRVLEVAVISQIPYCIMEKEFKLNICFLWLIGISCITVLNKLEKVYKKVLLLIIVMLVILSLNIDYGIYGFLYLLIMYYGISYDKIRNNDLFFYISWVVLHLLKIALDCSAGVIQLFTLPTIPIIDICNKYGLEDKRSKNIIIHFFYPIHMIILLFIYNLLKIL